MQEIRGALRMGGGREDEAFIHLQDRQPGRDVGGVILAHLRRDAEVGRQKRGPQLGNQFLACVAFITPAHAAKIARKAPLVLGPVRQLVRERCGVALRIPKGLEGRHLHIVRLLGVVGARPAVADVGAGRGEKPVGGVEALHRREQGRCGLRAVMRGQVVALLGVEHGVALHVGDFVFDRLAPGVGLGAGDAVGIDDQFALLSLAHIAAEFDRLFEGQP